MNSEINEENHDATPIPGHYGLPYGSPLHCQQTYGWAVKICCEEACFRFGICGLCEL